MQEPTPSALSWLSSLYENNSNMHISRRRGLRVQFPFTDQRIIDWIDQYYNCHTTRMKAGRARLEINGREALRFLKDILPYIRIETRKNETLEMIRAAELED